MTAIRVATSASEKALTVPPLFSARSVSLRRPSSSSQALAPSMNIHRTPFSGRNFECYSEDGFLSGRFGAATVHGARSKGVITFVKHFALNDQETMRTTVATLSNEQAIREVYLAAFEPSVSGGDEGTLGIMLIMNRVGLVWSGDHRGLVTNVVRGEWGFDGVVITDQASYPQAFPQSCHERHLLHYGGCPRNGNLAEGPDGCRCGGRCRCGRRRMGNRPQHAQDYGKGL